MTSLVQVNDTLLGRAEGALLGLALGEAMGLPSEHWPHSRIREHFGWIDRLLPVPTAQPASQQRVAGRVGHGTREAIALAETIVDGGGSLCPVTLAHRLATITGLTRSLTAGRSAVLARVAPLGILHTTRDLAALVDSVVEATRPPHRSNAVVAGAALVAGVIASALDAPAGATHPTFLAAHLEIGFRAAEIGLEHGQPVAAPSVIQRSLLAREIAATAPDDAMFLEHLYDVVGATGTSGEVVPAAVGVLVRGGGDPMRVAALAANLGGETTTIGALATSMAGAVNGAASIAADAAQTVQSVNRIGLRGLAAGLVGLRR